MQSVLWTSAAASAGDQREKKIRSRHRIKQWHCGLSDSRHFLQQIDLSIASSLLASTRSTWKWARTQKTEEFFMLLSSVRTLGHKWDYIVLPTPPLSILSNDIILMYVYMGGRIRILTFSLFYIPVLNMIISHYMYARIQFRLIMLLVSLLLSHHLNVIIIIIMFENIPYLEINRKKEKKN